MLPEPDATARDLSKQLGALIVAEIEAHGPMRFQRYMELALYAPGYGYYAAGAQKFGAAGDFVTAPELGAVFAQCVAETLAPGFLALGETTLLELGAGSGALAVDLLQALQARGALPARYLILERSADLRERQYARLSAALPQLIDRIVWLDQPPVQAFDGAIIGNEIVDALACARFVITADGPREIAVGVEDGHLVQTHLAPSAKLALAIAQLQAQLPDALPLGYVSEVIPELPEWFTSISAPLRRGVVLLADYGYGRAEYYSPTRRDGTLICHYRHRAHNQPYWYPGLNDLSASVDFTAVAEAAHACDFDLLAYDHQSGFVLGAGIEQLYAHLADLDDRARLRITAELKQLMLPGMMGERFKVMLLGRGVSASILPLGLRGAGQRRLL